MNRLIGLLMVENDLTASRLRRIYRELCKKAHPDLGSGTDAEFVELRREYEEALGILKGGTSAVPGASAASGARPVPGESSANPRMSVLRLLYLYAVRFYGSDSGRILSALTAACRDYDPGIQATLLEYRRLFFDSFREWRHSGPVYYTHNLLIASIMQLFYSFTVSARRHGMLLEAFLGDMEKRAEGLSGDRRRVLAALGSWLREEAGRGMGF